MADAPSSRFTYKRRGAKPYDVSHSFVQRVTSSVTQLLPQPAWLSQWFAQSERKVGSTSTTAVRQAVEASHNDMQPAGSPEISEDEEDSSDEAEQPVVKSHPKIPLNKTFPASSFRIHHLNDATAEADGNEVQESQNHDAEPLPKTGPSGFTRQTKFVSSTPAIGNQTTSHSNTRRLDTTYSSPVLPVRTVHDECVSGEIATRSTQTPRSSLGNAEEKVNGGDDQSITSESTSVSSIAAKPATYKHLCLTSGSNKRRRIFGEDDIEDQLEDAHHLQSPRNLNLERKRARLIQNLNCSSASQHEATLGSRNPSFNIDVYQSRQGNESRANLLSSSFYVGETTYGGASAYERRRSLLQQHSPSPACFPRLGAVEVRPKVESPRVIDTGVSRTARRILDTLQQLSTPVREARGIPLPTQQSQSPGSVRSGPPIRPLNMPSVPELLRLRQKERIQSTMSSARAVASSRREPAQEEYSLRLGEFQGSSKYVSKMKSKQNNTAVEDPATPLNLPNVPLPITTLPKFDLGFSAVSLSGTMPSTSSTFSSVGTNIVGSAVQTLSQIQTVTPASSTVIPLPVTSTAGQEVPVFTFRRPLDPQDEDEERAVLDSVVSALNRSVYNFTNSNTSRELHVVGKSKYIGQCFGSEGKSELVSNSNPGVFSSDSESQRLKGLREQSSDSSKHIGDKWQCKSCAARNATNCDKCVCGQLHDSSSAVSPGFGTQFKLLDDMWECVTCMVRNKNSDASCVACTTPKPAAKCTPSQDPQTCTKSDFGDKFKPPANSWECTTCLVQNPESLSKCQACTTEKPQAKQRISSSGGGKSISSVGNQLKKQEGSWYCTVCMACNKPGTKKCSSCDYVNPNSNQSGLQFKFDIPPEASKFKFGVDKAGDNAAKSSDGSVGSFSFGGSTKTTVAITFSFGIPTTSTSSAKSQITDATESVMLPGKTGIALLSSSLQNKSENQSQPAKTASTSKKRSKDAQEEVDDSLEARTSVDRMENKGDAKKISFCFEPSKGFGTSTDIGPKQDSVVSSSAGVLSTPTSSPFSTPKNNVTPKSSLASNPGNNFLSANLTGRAPVLVKTSADTLISSSVVTAISDRLPTITSSASKYSEITTSSETTAFPKEQSFDSESSRKLNAASKQTDFGAWPSSTLSDSSSVTSFPKLSPVFGSTSVSSNLGVTKIAAFGTSCPVTSAVSNVNSTSVTVTTATVMQGSVNSGSVFSTPASASFTLTPSSAVFGAPSTVIQTLSSAVTTTTPSLVFPTARASVFTSTASTIPSVFGAVTTTTTSTTTPIFGVTSTTAPPVFGATATTTATPVFAATVTTTATPMFVATTTNTLFGGITTPATPVFGAASPAATPVFGIATTTSSSIFGVASTTTAPTFGAATTTSTASVFGVVPTTATPMFGTTSTTASSVFGVASTTATPLFGTNNTTSPVFGVATTIAQSAFGTVTTASPSVFGSNTGTSAPGFGGATATPNFGSTAATSGFGVPGSNFGAGTAAAPAFGTALSSGFGAPTTTTAGAFGSNTTLTQSFENSSSPHVFGGLNNDAKSSLPQSTDKPVTTLTFGANSNGQATQSQPFQFTSNQSNSVSKPDFSFGSANVSGPQRPGFGFGSSPQQPSPFGFGSSTTAPTAPATLFPPGNSATAPGSGSLFGSAQASSNFGGTNASSGFTAGSYNFGQQNTNNVFGFSGAQASAPSASTSSPAQPFSFGQSTPMPIPVQFDPNAKPTFNFTGGETPSFTASAVAGTTLTAHRKIKKATRRSHQHR